MTRKERLHERNTKVRQFFSALEKKHPQWKLSALLHETSQNFLPISPTTVSAIIKEYGDYATDNSRYRTKTIPSLFDEI